MNTDKTEKHDAWAKFYQSNTMDKYLQETKHDPSSSLPNLSGDYKEDQQRLKQLLTDTEYKKLNATFRAQLYRANRSRTTISVSKKTLSLLDDAKRRTHADSIDEAIEYLADERYQHDWALADYQASDNVLVVKGKNPDVDIIEILHKTPDPMRRAIGHALFALHAPHVAKHARQDLNTLSTHYKRHDKLASEISFAMDFGIYKRPLIPKLIIDKAIDQTILDYLERQHKFWPDQIWYALFCEHAHILTTKPKNASTFLRTLDNLIWQLSNKDASDE